VNFLLQIRKHAARCAPRDRPGDAPTAVFLRIRIGRSAKTGIVAGYAPRRRRKGARILLG